MKPRLGMSARTGDKCPKSGVWRAQGVSESVTMSVSRGNRMPMCANRSVNWVLIIMF